MDILDPLHLSDNLKALQGRLGYHFSKPDLLKEALCHPSCLQENPKAQHNQRLEFLGDAALGCIIAEKLWLEFKDADEGFLSRARSALINEAYLAKLARKLELQGCLHLSQAEEKAGGREQDKALADAFEAIVGAVYCDGNYTACQKVLLKLYKKSSEELTRLLQEGNPKGRLQELLQAENLGRANYRISEISGPEHGLRYGVELHVCEKLWGKGEGTSRKEAEQAAARDALKQIEKQAAKAPRQTGKARTKPLSEQAAKASEQTGETRAKLPSEDL